jgi:TATA-binding protein-associated factor
MLPKKHQSRLDGLLALLEAKDTSVSIRRLAAQQLAELVQVQAGDTTVVLEAAALNVLEHLLRVVLQSKYWDARIQAAQGLRNVIQRLEPYLRLGPSEGVEFSFGDQGITLSQLDPLAILETGSVLASSSGAEYEDSAVDPRQQWLELRRELLGGVAASVVDLDIGVSFADIETAEVKKDVMIEPGARNREMSNSRDLDQIRAQLSKRQRKPTNASASVLPSSSAASPETNEAVDSRPEEMANRSAESAPSEQIITPSDQQEDSDSTVCPLTDAVWRLLNVLTDALLSPDWERRHGAAVAFREILSRKVFRDWLPTAECEDIASRLYVLLAMDRFGDYAFEQVVAPVRETAAMALGSVAVALSPESATRLGTLILELVRYPKDWQVRHGGLLGLRYLLAVRPELRDQKLAEILPALTKTLQEDDDDVKAAACEALIPIADDIRRVDLEHRMRTHGTLLHVCWGSLLELDDLSACTTSLVRCIEALITTCPSSSAMMGDDLARLVRLLRHRNVETRRAALSCIHQMLQHWQPSSPEYHRLLKSGLMTALMAALLLETGSDDVSVQRLRQCWSLLCATPCQESTRHVGVDTETALQEEQQREESSSKRLRRVAPLGTGNSPANTSFQPNDCPRHPLDLHLVDVVSTCRSPAEAQKALGPFFQKMRWILPVTATANARNDQAAGYQMQLLMAEALMHYRRMHTQDANEHGNALVSWLASLASSRWLLKQLLLCLFGRVTDSLAPPLATAVQSRLSLLEPGQDTIHEEARRALNALFWQTLKTLRELQPEAVPSLETVNSIQVTDLERLYQCCQQDALWRQVREPEAAARLAAMRRNVCAAIAQCLRMEHTLRLLVAAAAVGALVRHQKIMPERVTPWVRILMSVLLQQLPNQLEACGQLDGGTWDVPEATQAVAARDLALLTQRLAPGSKARDQIVKNLVTAANARALAELARAYGSELFTALPQLEQEVFPVPDHDSANSWSTQQHPQNAERAQRRDIVLCAIAEALDAALVPRVLSLFPVLIQSRARAVVSLCRLFTPPAMEAIIENLLPLLEPGEHASAIAGSRSATATDSDAEAQRYQALLLLADIIQGLGERIIPYAAFLVVPLLARLVDYNERIRSIAASVFGSLVRLLPLEGTLPEEHRLAPHLAEQLQTARHFIAQLLGQKPLERFALSIPLGDNVQLRSYQQEGLDWLVFLHRYGLHGALCDDMGLGKTLMTLCLLAADRHDLPSATSLTPRRRNAHEDTNENVLTRPAHVSVPLPSLVICPASVMHHWHDEVVRFFPRHLTPVLVYAGPPSQRQALRKRLQQRDAPVDSTVPAIVITSYEVARSDIEVLSTLCFSYVVLDEGHMIKNAHAKVSQAIRQIQARHRLILTGTPIQNAVTELWSLFDFLMPGFLGTEQAFTAQYAKPIQAARNPKCSDAAREAGERALAALHRQVLPFVLRRMKEDVMKELPPKVIQDRICELSDIQRFLYDSFVQSARLEWLETATAATPTNVDDGPTRATPNNVFYALVFLRRLCTHPRLVLPELNVEIRRQVEQLLRQTRLDWHDLRIAPKMAALRDLLLECGIAPDSADLEDGGPLIEPGSDAVLSTLRPERKHRALIFAQLKETLDTVEHDVFQRYLPQVTYLRLDGRVEPRLRQDIVHRFNRDPTIDCLLLTTHVGGLGLNLTGADTVIFVECDYNPTVDLQAMDRAHRIGQTRVVTVYRMITRGTIEEKIMSIQRFKMHLANTVVNQENASLRFMNTEQIMDLFHPVASAEVAAGTRAGYDGSMVTDNASVAMPKAFSPLPGMRRAGASMLASASAPDLESYGEEFQRTREFVQQLLAHESDANTK